MIIKIKRVGCNTEWTYIDAVNRLDVSKSIYQKDRKDIPITEETIFMVDNYEYSNLCSCEAADFPCKICGIPEDYKVKVLSCDFGDEDVAHIIFDTVAYVLNDAGSTIDTIKV